MSEESSELRFIHKAWRRERGERRSADTGAVGAGRKKRQRGRMARKREKTETTQGKGMARGEKERCGRGHAVWMSVSALLCLPSFTLQINHSRQGLGRK